jgi:hypothetical protein
MKQSKDGSTKNLLTHINKCLGKTPAKQTTIGKKVEQTMSINKVKQEHKTWHCLK